MAEVFAAFGIDWRLLIAQTINFLIVFGGLTFFLYKPVLKIINEREEKIARGVKDAEEAARAKEKIEAEKTSILSSAQTEASDIVGRAEKEAKRERVGIVKQAQERAEDILNDANAQGEELKRSLMKESEKEIARTAILAAEKIMKEKTP